MTSNNGFFNAFQSYMQSGDTSLLTPYMIGPQPESFLAIYRNGFLKAAMEALRGNFPTLSHLLTSDHFLYLSRSYVDLYPPSSASLVGYGMSKSDVKVSFIDFLRTEESLQEYAYLLDICLLDEVWLYTLNMASSSSLGLSEVQELIASGKDLSLLPMTLIPSSNIITLSFDVFNLWSETKFSGSSKEYALNTESIKRVDNFLLLWQQKNQVQAKVLSLADKEFLQTLSSTFNLEKAEEAASLINNNFDLSLLFADLLNGGLLTLTE